MHLGAHVSDVRLKLLDLFANAVLALDLEVFVLATLLVAVGLRAVCNIRLLLRFAALVLESSLAGTPAGHVAAAHGSKLLLVASGLVVLILGLQLLEHSLIQQHVVAQVSLVAHAGSALGSGRPGVFVL